MTLTYLEHKQQMSYLDACKLMDINPSRSKFENAKFAQSMKSKLNQNASLKYKVACQVIMEAAL